MVRIFLGCTSILSSVIILCTGFILSGLNSLQDAITSRSGGFVYSIFDINLFWFIVPILLFIIGVIFIYSNSEK